MEQNSKIGLVEAVKSRIEEILRGVSWLKGWKILDISPREDSGADLRVAMPLPQGGEADLYIQCKAELRPSVFLQLAERTRIPTGRRNMGVRVLALPNMSPRLAELCAEYYWSWLDLAGNYRLEVPGVLHLRHTGNQPVQRRPRPRATLGTSEAGRVIRALLAPENLGRRWTQREMQVESQPNVSLGLVNKIVRFLREEAYIERSPGGGFKLCDPMRLLFAWRDSYHFDHHERRNYFSLLQGKRLQAALAEFGEQAGSLAALAAFSAADVQAPHVRQPKTWLYVDRRRISTLEKQVGIKQVDSGENLVVLIPADEGVFYLTDRSPANPHRMASTNLVQTYVDLAHCGGRGEEAAEALLDQRLKPAWWAARIQ